MIRYILSGRRLALTIVVMIITLVFCGLGFWQLGRLNQRLGLIAYVQARMAEPAIALTGSETADPGALDYRSVTLRGSFDPSQEILRRNRSANGATGFHIVTPFKLHGSDNAVLVDRGWIPYDQASPEQRRAFAPPTGEVEIDGVVQVSQEATTGPFDPPVVAGQRLDAWFRINVERIQAQVRVPLLPFFVEQQSNGEPQESYPIRGITPLPDPGNHMSYAIQWFAFAVILVGGYGAIMAQQAQRALGIPPRTSDSMRKLQEPQN